jgi:UDP-3-O-[3-hydroxymyristoyl] glucosamine N-acyltransferase LpxD
VNEIERFKSFLEIWPKGLNQFKVEVSSLGFETEWGGILTDTLAQNHEFLKTLRHPRSFQYPEASHGDFTYVGTQTEKNPPSGQWGLVFVDRKNQKTIESLSHLRLVITNNPDALMDYCLRKMALPEWAGDSEKIPLKVFAETGVILGPHTHIGEGTVLESGVRIGARVFIGKNCRIGAFCRIADDSVLGDHCTLTSHVSIGGQGFGFVKYPLEAQKRPRLHVGRVRVGSRVRLGSFVSIDRGVFEETLVGTDSALDNIVQVGHNSQVGKNAIFCSFVGLSGSTIVGDRVTIAGMCGTKDHVKIGNDVTIAAQTGVSRDLQDKEIVKGYPPRPLKEALEIQTLTTKLPEIWQRLKKMEKEKGNS